MSKINKSGSDKDTEETQSLVGKTLVRFVKGGVSGCISGALLQPL